MVMNAAKHEVKRAERKELIAECRNSGKSVREWCWEKGVHPTTYYRWEREYWEQEPEMESSTASGTTGTGLFVELPLYRQETESISRDVAPETPVFEPVAVVRKGELELSLANGISHDLMEELKELIAHAE